MSEQRIKRAYSKKYSVNSDSTSLNSSNNNTNRVIQAQKISSNKLIDHLYTVKDVPVNSQPQASFSSSPQIGQWGQINDKWKEDPFLKAKMQYIMGQSSKASRVKKSGVLFEQLNAETFEDENLTTLKQEKELRQKSEQNSLMEMWEKKRRANK